jgi:frataxin-like iron-binding protein CyaY
MSDSIPSLKKIEYKNLTAKQKELFNFQKIASKLADYGFNCIKLADDWQGADFLAYHIDGETTLKVQLKSRITIDKKYQNKNIWIAFPHNENWYLVHHDHLVKQIGLHTKWLNSPSWTKEDGYSSICINPELLKNIDQNKLND